MDIHFLIGCIPKSSGNPDIDRLAGDKPRLVILNRIDLADPKCTARWHKAFESQGLAVLETDAKSGKGVKDFAPAIRRLLAEKLADFAAKGQVGRPLRVMVLGIPNVGKSSIMNAMIGEKVAIVSNRPQTTRNRIMGVITTENHQFVFLDTPGIHDPRTRLGEYMMHSVKDAMEGMDCVLMVVDVTSVREKDISIARDLSEKKVPQILAINKIDLVKPEEILKVTAQFAEFGFDDILPVSAVSGEGLEKLSSLLTSHLPEGPKYFPEDMMTDQPERLLCAEIIREKALRHLRDEIPHGIGVEMMGIEKISEKLTEINATLYCERDSHKRIIIGKQGSMLKIIGSEAREDMEKLLGTQINLKLWVKIRPDWRNNLSDLRTLGYEAK